jgi:methyl-accepting chemotaxis protein
LIGASAKNTAQGYAQIEKAGETMEEIVASTQRVSDIIAEITAASLEQSSGIDQVNNAVGHMDRATQQNAALVEQAAAAAESLMEQSNMLAQSVSKFTVRGDENRSTRETVKPSYRAESVPQRESKPLMSVQARIPNDDPDWKLF